MAESVLTHPPDPWHPLFVQAMLTSVGARCQGSPAYPQCCAVQGQPHPATGTPVILTIVQRDWASTPLDEDPLRVWCQRCRHSYEVAQRQATRLLPHREHEARQLSLLEPRRPKDARTAT